MLRILFVIAMLTWLTGLAFVGPFYGLLLYLWIAYFRPEMWVWSGALAGIPLSFAAGVFLLARTVLSHERIKLNAGAVLMLAFLTQAFLSTIFSPHMDYAWPWFVDFVKAIVVSSLIITLVTSERRFRLTLLVIAGCVAFEGAKQGWLQLLLNPGAQNLNEVAYFGDNNGTAVGVLMCVPLLVALARTASTSWEKRLFGFLAIGLLYRGVSTYSRGGFLACGVLALSYLWYSPRRVRSILIAVLTISLIIPVLPDKFWDRMQTMSAPAEERDQSAEGRLHFWQVAMVMAADQPLFGVGHNSFNAAYDKYDFSNGLYGRERSVHSAWFAVLAESGYPGLFLFLSILFLAFWKLFQVGRRYRSGENREYAIALQASLLVFMTGGSFVVFQYKEILWHLFGLGFALAAYSLKPAENEASEQLPDSTPVEALDDDPDRLPWARPRPAGGLAPVATHGTVSLDTAR